jgi:hypothetical protein
MFAALVSIGTVSTGKDRVPGHNDVARTDERNYGTKSGYGWLSMD